MICDVSVNTRGRTFHRISAVHMPADFDIWLHSPRESTKSRRTFSLSGCMGPTFSVVSRWNPFVNSRFPIDRVRFCETKEMRDGEGRDGRDCVRILNVSVAVDRTKHSVAREIGSISGRISQWPMVAPARGAGFC